MEQFSRTELLIGEEGMGKLKNSKVAIFGIGGVGSFTAEALCRCGVGNIILIDYDDICITNINRQIHATRKTVGRSKVEVMKERLLDINPDANITIFKDMYNEEKSDQLLSDEYDYVVDAIDMVTSKINLIEKCTMFEVPIVSCMGAGNKFDPTRFEVADIYETSVCPLAKVMRSELRKRGIQKLKVVYSKEVPVTPLQQEKSCESHCVCTKRRQTPGSISFVPSVAGLILASVVVRGILTLN